MPAQYLYRKISISSTSEGEALTYSLLVEQAGNKEEERFRKLEKMGHNYLPEGDVENHKEAAVTNCLHSMTILPLRNIKKRLCLIISKIHRPTEKGT
jgi:hypothetical protein